MSVPVHECAVSSWGALLTLLEGDKETFWTGFLLAGDESYSFHHGGVGIMGVAERVPESEDAIEATKGLPGMDVKSDSHAAKQTSGPATGS